MPFTAPALRAKELTVRRAASPAEETVRTARTSAGTTSRVVRKENLRSRVVVSLSTGPRHAMDLSVAGSTRFRPKGDAEGRGYHESVSQLTPEERGELAYYAGYEPPEPVRHEPRFRFLRKLAAPFVLVGALLLKFKFIFFAIFKFKIFTTSGTMLVSVAAYTLFWGWKFAFGFVLLMFVHEMGHVLEAKRQGIPVSAPIFIPFLGAAIIPKAAFPNVWAEAKLAAGGPILGSIGAAAVWIAGEAYDSEFLIALAFTGFFLNLINLLPVSPLDGGRMAAALHPALWIVGLIGLVGLTFLAPNPILILILVLGGLDVWNRWKTRNSVAGLEYYRVEPWQKGVIAGLYLGLIIALAASMSATHIEKDF
jgi:Zn-dependent protease